MKAKELTGLQVLGLTIFNNRSKWNRIQISDVKFQELYREAAIQDDKYKVRYQKSHEIIIEFGVETQRKRLDLWTEVYLKCVEKGINSDNCHQFANSSLSSFDKQFKIDIED